VSALILQNPEFYGEAIVAVGSMAAVLYLAFRQLAAKKAVVLLALFSAALFSAALLATITQTTGLLLLMAVTALWCGLLGWWLGRRQNVTIASAASRSAAPRSAVNTHHSKLGRYLLERQIGRGAMGAVYLGRDPQIGRHVAIKTMALQHEFAAGPDLTEARARFFLEAEMAGRLQHPDIVTIFDAGEENGLAYIAMEFVKGQDLLKHTTRAHLLPLHDVLEITAQVADALAYAHSQGVVHRDVKPANIMFDASTRAVKVTDFGIARVTDSSRSRTGRVLGSPSFMSPEQMTGGRIDGRSDIYSLGVTLFQLTTGALPHPSHSMSELMHQIAKEPAPDVRTVCPALPEALARLIAAALEKNPALRPSNGAQMAAQLRMVNA
jgi:eukaryotic-like serine/threonine-protein kinase